MSFRPVSISLPPRDHSALNSHLDREGMTRSEYVRNLIRRDLAACAAAAAAVASPPSAPADPVRSTLDPRTPEGGRRDL